MVNAARPSRLRSRGGFALVDVITASVLMGIALAVAIGISGHAISSQARGRDLQTAAALADEQLSLVLARGPDDYARRYPTRGECDAPFQDFTYDLALTGGSASEPVRVKCTISWARASTPQSIAIETLVAPRLVAGSEEPDPPRNPNETITRPQ
ncbi:MAG: hypothetical protein KF745_04970 [Phycisphaeraceae bacterium]|nr:hypothetical protein [Phycisphaeraceae bacterium]